MHQELQFRRQFLIAKVQIEPLNEWRCLKIDHYFLYVHPDLEVHQVSGLNNDMVLIGSLFDPYKPEKRNLSILREIHSNANSLEDLFLQIKRYAGRYAVLYKNNQSAAIFHDALGLMELYYCTKNNQIVCGSQPNLLAEFANPAIGSTNNPELLEFYKRHSKDSKWNPSYKWIGDETYYEGIKHLLPNHYLDITRQEARRYWPNEPIKKLDLGEAVSDICSFLQGSLQAIANRHSIMMAVTSGTDSRTLLAASRGIQEKVYYFINDHGLGHNHSDIAVPKKIFKGIDLPFHVHDVPKDVDNEFRRIFQKNTFFASDRLLPTIYNVYYKDHGEKVNIQGTGEIGRTRYGKEPEKLNGYLLGYKLGYKDDPYAIKEGEKILAELLPVGRTYGLNVLTLLYWEHTLGNWGATGNSESDIAIEELDPYDSHKLFEIFLGVDGRYTKFTNPILFREMIRNMWPQLLEWPINPPHTPRDNIKLLIKKLGLYRFAKEIKYQMNYFEYRYKAKLKRVS